MSVSENASAQRNVLDGEIDLFEIFHAIWSFKWMVVSITVLTLFCGLVFSSLRPITYTGEIDFRRGDSSSFLRFVPANKVLLNSNILATIDDKSSFLINERRVFDAVYHELDDFQIIKSILENDRFVVQKLSQAPLDERDRLLIDLTKSFQLKRGGSDGYSGTISYEWHDEKAANDVIKAAFSVAFDRTKHQIKSNALHFANLIEDANNQEIAQLNASLENLRQIEELRNEGIVNLLREQAAIARSLKIETNSLTEFGLAQTDLEFLRGNSYYLRGFDAIEQEIEIAEARSFDNTSIYSEQALDIENRLAEVRDDKTATMLRGYSQLIDEMPVADMVDLRLEFAERKSNSKKALILAISLMLGGILGVSAVLLRHAINNRRKNLRAL